MAYRVMPALCLDLDGTVRGSKGGAPFGPTSPEDVELLPNVAETVWRYRDEGWYILGVTNQGVIACGTRTREQVEEVIRATRHSFGGRGDPFHDVRYSPSLPAESGGKVAPHARVSLLRKPNYGLLVLAEGHALHTRSPGCEGIILDWPHSLFVGDRPEDMACARAAGVAFRWAWAFFGWEEPLAGKTWGERTAVVGCSCDGWDARLCAGADKGAVLQSPAVCACRCHEAP